MTDFNSLFQQENAELIRRREQDAQAARDLERFQQQERARKQPYIDQGNRLYVNTVTHVINALRQHGVPMQKERGLKFAFWELRTPKYNNPADDYYGGPLDTNINNDWPQQRLSFYGMRVFSSEITQWGHLSIGIYGESEPQNPLKVVDLTEYPTGQDTIALADDNPNLYYNPGTNQIFLSELSKSYDDKYKPQIDIISWLAKATVAKIHGLS